MGVDAEMLVKIKWPSGERPADLKDRIRKWAWQACSAFGHERFFINRGGKWSEPHGAISEVSKWEQDGPTLRPKAGETFLKVHLMTRWYGIGYERGDLPFLLALADWVEMVIPHSEVWYGGDSSGVLAEPFGKVERSALWKHFCEHDHQPYYRRTGLKEDQLDKNTPTCPMCLETMDRYGWGPRYAAWSCPCGWEVIYKDGMTHSGERRDLKDKGVIVT